MDEKFYRLSSAELEDICEKAARRALKSVGLHDEKAATDILDLRDLLNSYRMAKNTLFTTLIKNIVNVLFAALIIGLTIKFGTWSNNP